MLVHRARIHAALVPERRSWPFTVPCVAELVDRGMTFTKPVTFLVGENGSGKSTLVEAFAEAYGSDARGGRAGRKYGNDRNKTPLGEVLTLDSTAAGARQRGGRGVERRAISSAPRPPSGSWTSSAVWPATGRRTPRP